MHIKLDRGAAASGFFRPILFTYINMEGLMQKRYCSCGSAVWVNYVNAESDWNVLFLFDPRRGFCLRLCPHCGRKLNIDELG